jgi:hypothetical protein
MRHSDRLHVSGAETVPERPPCQDDSGSPFATFERISDFRRCKTHPQEATQIMTARDTNARTYALGQRVAFCLSNLRDTGVKPRSALATAADEFGATPAEARAASAFATTVNAITANVGSAAKELILSDHPRLPLPVVMRISRTHPDRQRFAIARAAEGRDPLGKPPPGTALPFDTHDCAEVLSRLARNAGALVCAAGGLLTAPFDRWPSEEKIAAVRDHTDAIRRACGRMKALARAAKPPTAEKPVHFADSAAPRRGGACPAKEVLGVVARLRE